MIINWYEKDERKTGETIGVCTADGKKFYVIVRTDDGEVIPLDIKKIGPRAR